MLCQIKPLVFTFIDLRQQSGAQSALLNEPPEGANAEEPSLRNIGLPAFIGVCYVICSAALTLQNKWLMNDRRFPFAVNLTLGHQVCGTAFLMAFYKVRPCMFPSLSNPSLFASIDWYRLSRGFVPIMLCLCGQLVLGNAALYYSSVSFLQMMKEGNLVLVYGMYLVAGLDQYHGLRLQIVLCLFLATLLAIHGESDFSQSGFVRQGLSQSLEATKVVLQSILLSTAGSRSLDPYTYNLLVQPTTACLITIALCACVSFQSAPTAAWADYAAWWPYLIVNGTLAMVMNVSATAFIGSTSAVGFIATNVAKDAFLVIVDIAYLGTSISTLQFGCFTLQLVFVAAYSLLKAFPKLLPQDKGGGESSSSEGKSFQ
jgi:hypothetical protein